jgi:hypothetical protein
MVSGITLLVAELNGGERENKKSEPPLGKR